MTHRSSFSSSSEAAYRCCHRLRLPIVAAAVLLHAQEHKRSFGSRHNTCSTQAEESSPSSSKDPTDEDKRKGQEKKEDNKLLFDVTKQWDGFTKKGGRTADEFFRSLIQSSNNDDDDDDDNNNNNNNNNTSPPTTTTTAPNQKNRKQEGILDKISQAMADALSAPSPDGDSGGEAQNTSTNTDKADAGPSSRENFEDMGQSFLKLLTAARASSSSGSSTSSNTVEEIVTKARGMSEHGDVADKASLTEILAVAQRAAAQLDQTLHKFLGGEEIFPILHPSNVFYYLEHEDQVKNPSWRRRQHRFFTGIGVDQVDDLNEKLRLALLSYNDSLDSIKLRLEQRFNCELAYCAMESFPGKPGHFIGVKKDQSSWSSSLEVLLVVRGTKTITDVITDVLCDADPYRGGFAHSGILEGGQYLVQKHEKMLRQLCKMAGKKRIKLTLIGHSMGAGAAAIAGMEFNDRDDFEVQVVGFGCPALLSKDLSEKSEAFITTVVADNDIIPRLSVATAVNAILNIGSYNWIPFARRDMEEAIGQVQNYLPSIVTEGNKKRIMSIVDDLLPNADSIPARSKRRMEPILFPPGKCVHFYRDGFGISGNVVPCTFFNEIDFSRRMLHDHLCETGYHLIFLDLMRQHHNDHYFRFDIDKTPV